MTRKKSAMKKEAARGGGGAGQVPVVGIGASAGGLEALKEFVGNVPAKTGMAYVVVTHQHPGHVSLLPELLGRETKMPVREVEDGILLESDHVYVGPAGKNLALLNGRLHLMGGDGGTVLRLPIDRFFRSLAEDRGDRAICVILSGTGTDGTLGMKAVKGASGMAMVQQPQTAKYAGMPSSAIATDLADYILPPAEMPGRLVAYARGSSLEGSAEKGGAPSIHGEPMEKIFVLLRGRTGHDFSSYKPSTLKRRIGRRMNVHQITEPENYVRYLQENPHEIDMLFRELLIGVTQFFRDPEAWESLGEGAWAELMKLRPDEHTWRVWVPGCATGEEVYTVAILLRECMARAGRHGDVQIFGTDLDSDAIEAARLGRFPEGIAADVSPERLERYFVREDGGFRVRSEVREMVIFAQQNVIRDPPFTKLDMISCRNLFIYLNAELQKRLLPIFHYALRPGGLLFLGPSETVGAYGDLFDTVDKRWKIFRRRENPLPVRVMPDIPAQPVRAGAGESLSSTEVGISKGRPTAGIVERALLGRYAPACVVASDRGEIVYIHGKTGDYLEPANGLPRNNLMEMAREGLRLELAAAMRKVAREGGDEVRKKVAVKTTGGVTEITLSVERIRDPEALRGLLLVAFFPEVPKPCADEGGGGEPEHGGADDGRRMALLQQELQDTKESLQMTVEELETSNEELKSTNEELQSTNEELQSTNEELETSKEEMQSLNEELTTVNAELQSKVEDLSLANNDMQNLLNSTDVATIFLDADFKVKRYTEHARKLVNLIPTDIGRPISDLRFQLKSGDLAAQCSEVLGTLVFKEGEVETSDGSWYLMRIMPYRTTENVIEGLVITFVNIDKVKRAEESGKEALAFSEAIVDTVREPLVILDGEFRVVTANRSFFRTFKTSLKQMQGEVFFELGAGQWETPELRRLLGEVVTEDRSFEDLEVESAFPKLGRRVFLLNGRRLQQGSGLPGMVLLAMEEVTNP